MKCATLLLLASSLILASSAEECNYEDLEMSLIKTKGNKYQLSSQFFPPVDNSPEFVEVHYTFLETGKQQTWYWSSTTSSFIHPPEVLQFMSLFFSKPHNFYSGKVQIKLDSYENRSVYGCAEVPELAKMQLLTQRLQLYAAQQTSTLKVDSSYTAKAYLCSDKENDTLKQFIFKQAVTYNLDLLLVITGLLIFLIPAVIIIIIAILVVNSEHKNWDDEIKRRIPLMCSFAVMSPVMCLYMLIVSICSIGFWYRTYEKDPLYKLGKSRNLGPIGITILINLLSTIYCISIIGSSCCAYNKQNNGNANTSPNQTSTNLTNGNASTSSNQTSTNGTNTSMPNTEQENASCFIKPWNLILSFLYNLVCCPRLNPENNSNPNNTNGCVSWYVLLSLTILGPIASIIAHSPYIAIAYLNDGYHAGSIFIYYTIVLCLGYSICWMSYHTLKVKSNSMQLSWTTATKYSILRGMIGFVMFIFLAIIITVYFVIIPINKSISDAPNRLVGIYQSGGFLIASFVTYKLVSFFYKINKRSSIDNAVTKWTMPFQQGEEQEAWNAKSSEDRIDDFYGVIVEIVSDKIKEVRT